MFIFVGNYTDNENEPYFHTDSEVGLIIFKPKTKSLSKIWKFTIQSEKVFFLIKIICTQVWGHLFDNVFVGGFHPDVNGVWNGNEKQRTCCLCRDDIRVSVIGFS